MMFGGHASLFGQAATKGVPMSTDPARRANLATITCDPRPQLPDGFRRNSKRIGTLLGAARTGLSVYELPPGQAVGPYHYEDPQEEWLVVVSGTPTLRHPGGENQLEPWDLVFFPSVPPEHTSCGTTASQPLASRCSPPSRRSVPSSTRTAT
jgi:Cupin domain